MFISSYPSTSNSYSKAKRAMLYCSLYALHKNNAKIEPKLYSKI